MPISRWSLLFSFVSTKTFSIYIVIKGWSSVVTSFIHKDVIWVRFVFTRMTCYTFCRWIFSCLTERYKRWQSDRILSKCSLNHTTFDGSLAVTLVWVGAADDWCYSLCLPVTWKNRRMVSHGTAWESDSEAAQWTQWSRFAHPTWPRPWDKNNSGSWRWKHINTGKERGDRSSPWCWITIIWYV